VPVQVRGRAGIPTVAAAAIVGGIVLFSCVVAIVVMRGSLDEPHPLQPAEQSETAGPYPECAAVVEWVKRRLKSWEESERRSDPDRKMTYTFIGVVEWGKRIVTDTDPFSNTPAVHVFVTYKYAYECLNPYLHDRLPDGKYRRYSVSGTSKQEGHFILKNGKVTEP
jgi:hypothetical protein